MVSMVFDLVGWYVLVVVYSFVFVVFFFFFFKQKTAYEMRISDWSSDVCSSDLAECACSSSQGSKALFSMPSRAEHTRGWSSTIKKSIALLPPLRGPDFSPGGPLSY